MKVFYSKHRANITQHWDHKKNSIKPLWKISCSSFSKVTIISRLYLPKHLKKPLKSHLKNMPLSKKETFGRTEHLS